ncbi:MAG: hypothetical protein V7K55_17625 [Nostoc sp.]|uniref:hypothetical protein n=1 Tax=Nostoc sp. TaxID=1180 RepID=UPI002FFCA6B3
MTLDKERITIGVFARCSDAQLALQELKASNFPMHKVSVIARNVEEQSDIAGVEAKERTSNTSGEDVNEVFNGGALGDLSGLLVGLVLWVIPGIGRVMIAGAEATAIATTLAGGLPSIFLNLGIPKEEARRYSDLICKGYYLLIVTGIDIEMRLAKRIFNRYDIQQRGQRSLNEPYLTPNSRYKHAIGVFYTRQDTERVLTELRSADFPMSQVLLVAKNRTSLSGICEGNLRSSQDNYTTLGIPHDLVRYYDEQVAVGHYLVVIKGTDIYIAGARAILESNKIQHFGIYSQSELNAARSDRQTTNF